MNNKDYIKVFTWIFTASAVGIIAYSLWNIPFQKFDLNLLGLTIASIFLSSTFSIQLPRTKIHLSVSEALLFITILYYGVEIAVLLAALESLYASYSLRFKGTNIKLQTIFINIDNAAVSTFLTGTLLSLIFPNVIATRNFHTTTVLVGVLTVLAITQFIGNSVVVAGISALRQNKKFLAVWNENCFNALIMYVVGATVAGSLIKTIERIDTILLLVTVSIAAVAYETYRRYVNDIKETSAKANQAERERAEQAENHVLELQHYVSELEDKTKALRDSERLFRHTAFHDALTELPNRNKFTERLQFLIEKSQHKPEFKFAVLFLDLNRFKTINDSLGHSIGNQLILHVAKRLANMVSEGDLVARFSGDEFAIILNNISGLDEAIDYAESVSRKISKPYTLNERQVFTSISIGIAMSHPRYREVEEILRDADIAMYQAKEKERRFVVFDQNMHTRAVTLLQIETDLRYAIERHELAVYYQPIINLDTMELNGFEALMRWNHPVRGMVPPDEFIPVSEVTGLIVPLTLWILRESCRQTVEWQNNFDNGKQMRISVNLSGKHFAQPDLVEQIKQILHETKLSAKCLKLEITESAVMENADRAIQMLKQLRRLGIQISVDDFGTGYSSLSYLHRFPINTLKIDRSFVSTMEDGTENGEIVRTIIALAKSLNLSVVAEGIESIHQLHQLRVLGCEYGQGFLFSRPVPFAEAERLISDSSRWHSILPRYRSGVIEQNKDFSILELDPEDPKPHDIIQ